MINTNNTVLLRGMIAFISTLLFLPLMLNAGSLDPSGPPAPTMKTLDQIPPTWSEKITTGRFVPVFDGLAVLDRETGLVWQQSPSSSSFHWANAIYLCANLQISERKGWHLPTVEQLTSLVTSLSYNPALPSDHPFSNLAHSPSDYYWTSTTSSYGTQDAMVVSFYIGHVSWKEKAVEYSPGWCVRGGQGVDPQ